MVARLLSFVVLVLLPVHAASQVLEVTGAYAGETMGVLSGGLARDAVYLGNLDLSVAVRGSEESPRSGLSLFVYALGNHGGEPSRLVGDAQGVSNIEAPEALRLFEAWIESDWADRGLSLLAGLYDLNSEFDVVHAADVFLNSAFGIGTEFADSGVTGPSVFPLASLGLRALWRRRGGTYVQAAVLDGVPGDPSDGTATRIRLSSEDGVLLVAEAGYHFDGPPAPRPPAASDAREGPVGRGWDPGESGKVALGLWGYTRRFDAIDPVDGGRLRSRPGVYVIAQSPPLDLGGRGSATVFGRAGWADPAVHRFHLYSGMGAVLTGVVPGREEDALGMGLAIAHNGAPYRRVEGGAGRPTTARETVVELTYRMGLTQRLGVQPDLQWVHRPDTDPAVRSALLAGLRVTVEF